MCVLNDRIYKINLMQEQSLRFASCGVVVAHARALSPPAPAGP